MRAGKCSNGGKATIAASGVTASPTPTCEQENAQRVESDHGTPRVCRALYREPSARVEFGLALNRGTTSRSSFGLKFNRDATPVSLSDRNAIDFRPPRSFSDGTLIQSNIDPVGPFWIAFQSARDRGVGTRLNLNRCSSPGLALDWISIGCCSRSASCLCTQTWTLCVSIVHVPGSHVHECSTGPLHPFQSAPDRGC